MGMTIDEAAYIIEHHKVNDINNAYDLGQAFTVAIDTMRKFQKIQEIINNTDYIQEDVIRYKMICGVMEDGKID